MRQRLLTKLEAFIAASSCITSQILSNTFFILQYLLCLSVHSWEYVKEYSHYLKGEATEDSMLRIVLGFINVILLLFYFTYRLCFWISSFALYLGSGLSVGTVWISCSVFHKRLLLFFILWLCQVVPLLLSLRVHPSLLVKRAPRWGGLVCIVVLGSASCICESDFESAELLSTAYYPETTVDLSHIQIHN